MNKRGYTENLYTPNSIRTFSGRYLDFTNIREQDIDIYDIAIGVASKIRFGGHMLSGSLTVAEHSIFVSKRVGKEHALAGLLHDATEAYIADVPKPLKHLLPEYCKIEDQLMAVIANKYGIQFPFHQQIKDADKLALQVEWNEGVITKNMSRLIMTIPQARLAFLNRFLELTT